MNAAFTQTFGYDLEDIPTLAEWWPKAYPGAGYRQWVAEAWQARIEKARREGTPFEPIEVNIVCKNGTVRSVIGGAASLTESFSGIHLVTLFDITDRKQAETERQKLEGQLRQAQKMEAIGTLAGGIAHDFNNILGAILGNVGLARQDLSPGHPVMQNLDQILKASQRAAGLVRQILAFSRRQPMEKRVVRLRSLIEEDARLLKATIPAGVQFTTEFSGESPDTQADPAEIHQVLLKLCTNSWHAMEGRSGRITFDLKLPWWMPNWHRATLTCGPAPAPGSA